MAARWLRGSRRGSMSAGVAKGTVMHLYTARRISIAVLISVSALAAGCIGSSPDDTGQATTLVSSVEGFEIGTKGAYAAADVTLGTGVWNLSDALIGGLSTDLKVGTKSARIRYGGRISMRFDLPTGAGTVSVRHGSFSSDPSGTWGLFASQDQGGTWAQVGASQT